MMLLSFSSGGCTASIKTQSGWWSGVCLQRANLQRARCPGTGGRLGCCDAVAATGQACELRIACPHTSL